MSEINKLNNNKPNKLARVAAVHDMCGFGKCSLATALPVISACGVEVSPVPTGIFSTNTNFPNYQFTDFTAQMPGFISHLKESGVTFDAVYSGFLGSAAQIGYIKELIKSFTPEYIIIDPVMGDNGEVYKFYTPEMCENMKSLVENADITTPNLTEACTLTGEKYKNIDISANGIKFLAEKVAKIGAKNIVITGIERNDRLYNCILLNNGEYTEREINLLPFRMHGTGDLFSSVLTGGILSGHNLIESVDSAALFVYEVMKYSRTVENFHERGACFEPFLYKLKGGVCK
ncbi:MAG: pyridoxamine kinase [Oscillospiraceae bacterium]|nr:pyridoxamine kinase [Oscillospiraceae bacterium]